MVLCKDRLEYRQGEAENKKSVVKYAKWYTPEKETEYPTSFKVDFVGQPYEGACYYRITRCPICAYAEKLGVSELMPLFCELDEVMITLQHGVLHRKQALANGGEFCDYVYHNITGKDKQQLLLETLRVLKKGGTFAIHDLMSPRRYGDMQAFVQKLMDMGYERVELMDTADGSFMTSKEAGHLMLHGSTLLVGRK